MHLILKGETDRRRREQNERMSLAWHIEALARRDRLPKLEKMLAEKKAPKRRQSAAELESVTRSWLGNRKSRQPAAHVIK